MTSLFKMLKDVETQGDEKAEAAKTEHALVFVSDSKNAWLLHGVGVAIESDLDSGLGRDEAGPTPYAPEELGLWVWEGIPHWASGWNHEYGVDEGAEPIYDKFGTWRRPTPEEVVKVASGDLVGLFGPSRWPPETASEHASEDKETK